MTQKLHTQVVKMGYISKYDYKFTTFLNRKYKDKKVFFTYFDDYILWLYYEDCKCNEDEYYSRLEDDIWEYSNSQTGKPKDEDYEENNRQYKKEND